jgi:hypothetical protein
MRYPTKFLLAGAALVIPALCAFAEPLPQPKPSAGGSCPFGYAASGSFCVPAKGAQDAIPKPAGGVCPFGWTASGNFCLHSGGDRR